MKNLLASASSLAALLLTSTSTFAHSGHLSNEAVHGFLHAEHVTMIIVVGFVALLAKLLGNK
ncbi:hypothetical protein ACFL3P_03480 [Pseudomonadota bacterium]